MSDVVISRPTVTVALTSPGAPPTVILGAPSAQVTIHRDGVPGPPGPAGPAVEAVADVAAPAGMPLAVSRANGHLVKADAASKAFAFVAGLAFEPTVIGFVGAAARDVVMLADWTAITGSAALLPGQTYFLAVGGGMTTTPPGSPNCITVVGKAASATTMLIDPQNPIQL